ncbi:MAG: outer membrane protein transport protein [Gammaproteobacteria bacterium]|nr:outer membrane protein transport protein [Gammaproteobacteria bacterium]MCW8923407.1 outer membrane protein transport protein [Gammaproteobacteria bacterium]
MILNSRHILLSALALGVALPLNAFATNGYFLIGFGSKSRAMGGTGVAYGMDGLASAFNPASMWDVGDSFDIGGEFFRPEIAIQHDSGLMGKTDEKSNHDQFMIPAMGGVYRVNDKVTIGAAMIGAGMKTEFNQTANNSACTAAGSGCPPTVFNILDNLASTEAGVELYQIQMTPSIAYKINEDHAIGATFVLAGQFFRAEGLEDFGFAGFTAGGAASTEAEARLGLTGVGFEHSFGAGYRLGWMAKFLNDDLSVGVNYSARVHMSKFTRYNKLFAEQGGFDIPENWTFGAAYKFTPAITGVFDIQRINYSDVASVGNPGPNPADPTDLNPLCPGADTPDCKLGGSQGMGFGWRDQTIYKLGVNWQFTEKLALRAGFNHGDAPMPEDQVLFNMLAPAVVEDHLTLGAEYKFNEDYWLSINYMHAFLNTIKGPTAFGVGGATVTGSNASIAMEQDSLGATLSIRF